MKIVTFLFLILFVINAKLALRQRKFRMPHKYNDNFKQISSPNPLYDAASFNYAINPNPNGDGGIQSNFSSVVEVKKPTKIYRVYSSNNPRGRIGGWWTFEEPSGTKENYRITYGICSSWSLLDKVVVCTLQPGSYIAMGPGKAVTQSCGGDEKYPANPAFQIFLNTRSNPPIYKFLDPECEDIPSPLK